MTFESDLVVLLGGIAPGAVFPDFAPVATARPYITFQGLGGQVLNPLCNEIPGKRNAEMQINVWADTRAQALSLIRSIEDAMRLATAFIARPSSAPVSDFDADTRVYGCLQTFSCWFDS